MARSGMASFVAAAALLATAVPLMALHGGMAGAGDWPSYGRDAAEQRFSPLDQITTTNVGQLGLVWSYAMRDGRGVESTPLMVNGVLYVTSAWSIVYALYAKTGRELWVYDPQVDRANGAKSCCDVVNRGVAMPTGASSSARSTVNATLMAISLHLAP